LQLSASNAFNLATMKDRLMLDLRSEKAEPTSKEQHLNERQIFMFEAISL
jgi:hypothetical protein